MRFDKPKGQRLHKRFYGVFVKRMWRVPAANMWMENIGGIEDYHMASNMCRCKTLKAFKRHLRKHENIRGKATLRSIYIGYDVYA